MSMKNYPLQPNKVNCRILHPLNVLSTEEYIAEHNDLYLSTEYPTDESGYPHRRFRLHAKYPHNIEQALAYDIKCPSCGNNLKQVGRCRDLHTPQMLHTLCRHLYARLCAIAETASGHERIDESGGKAVSGSSCIYYRHL